MRRLLVVALAALAVLSGTIDPADPFNPAPAHRYRDRILAAGGSKDAAVLVEEFLGRPFAFDAFAAWLDREPVTAGH